MVLANQELTTWMGHINRVSVSPAYNYALKLRNTKSVTRVASYKKELNFFADLIMQYDGNKKKMLMQTGITVPDLYVLAYMHDEREKSSSPCYKEVFREGYFASRKPILESFNKLTSMGYLQTFNKNRYQTYKITALGKNTFNECVIKYMLPK
ncbi:MAG: hypothetical protein NVS1B13_20970 [Flavisolibacter sp.]